MKIERKLNKEKNKKHIINSLDEGSIQEIRPFSVKEFRKQLKQGNGLVALKQFLIAIKNSKERDYIVEYLNIGGNCLELLQNITIYNEITAVLVFELVTLILIKMGYENQEQNALTYRACCYIFNNYIDIVTEMVSRSTLTQESYMGMKLLIAMVTCLSNLVREISSDLYFRATNTELLMKDIGEIGSIHDFLLKLSEIGYPALVHILKQIKIVIAVLQNSSVYKRANGQYNVKSKL